MIAVVGPQELRAAAELIRTKGHCKHELHDDEGRYCAVGAIFAVTAGLDSLPPFLNSISGELFPGQFEYGQENLVCFNNHPDTTAEDVISVLEKAAARLEEAVL
jgi:hypothetical protein